MSEHLPTRWPVSLELPVLWGDMDAFGHVNNTIYLRWFESARIEYLERIGLNARMRAERVGPILAHTRCDFLLPLTFPDTVLAEATLARVGTTSFTMAYRVRSRAHGLAEAARGEGVVVLFDYARGAKVPLDAELRAAIERLQADPA